MERPVLLLRIPAIERELVMRMRWMLSPGWAAICLLWTTTLLTAAECQSEQNGEWSRVTTWSGGRVPQAGDSVEIREGHAVIYDRTFPHALGTLQVRGSLTFRPKSSLELKVHRNIVLTGELKLAPSSPRVRHVITFEGIDEAAFVGGGMKVLSSDVGRWACGSWGWPAVMDQPRLYIVEGLAAETDG